MMAGTLNEASSNSIYQLTQKADVKTALTGLVTACEAIFPDDNENARTVGNWLVLLRALATTMTTASAGLFPPFYELAGDYVSRFYQAGTSALAASRITAAQAAAMLAAWNTHLGTP